jgi:lipid II:glycine glycyltransferase (peptidoglycan interpeptide bridge formation enzyme)
VDLEKDFFNQEFTSKCRNVVRKAQKNNILIDFDFDGKYIDEFYDLYNQMAIKNQIGSYYLFDKDYIDNTFETMRGNVFIARAVYDGVPMSSAMFLYNDKYLHYHLSGNNYEFTSFGGNSLILYEVSKWGQAHGIKQLHLGGAFEGGLLKFKSSFTKDGFLDFYVGMRIRDNKKYNLLVKLFGKNENGYFPEYRR